MTKPLIVGANGLPSQLPDSTPLQTNSPCCAISGGTTLITGVDTAAQFSIQSGNFTGWVSGQNTRLTIQTAGFYLCGYSALFTANSNGSRQLWIRVNGGAGLIARQIFTGLSSSTGANLALLSLSAGDYLELLANQNSGISLSISATLYTSRVSN